MSSQNPINIIDDDDLIEESRKQLQMELNRHTLLKATMGNRFDIIIAVLKIDMEGTQQEKTQRIRNRIQKFFDYGEKKINLSKHEHFFERRELEANAELVQNEVVLFGVDFLSSKRIKTIFPQEEPKIRWLDDSHCKLTFSDPDKAKEAIMKNLRDPEIYKVKMEEQSEDLPKNWFQIQPYHEMGFERRLYCRYATTNEDEGVIKSKNYHLFLQARKTFEQSMAKQIQPSFEKHVINLGLSSMLSRHRRTRASTNQTNDGERSHERSRERRNGGQRRGNRNGDFNRNRGNGERGFVRENRWNNGQRGGFNRNRRDQNDDLSISPDQRPRRNRNRSPSSVSGSNKDQSQNFSFLLEADPLDMERDLERRFGDLGMIEPDNISFIGKQEQIHQSEEPMNISFDQVSNNLNNSQISMSRKKQDQNISWSYTVYNNEVDELERQAQKQKKNNISIVEID